MPIYDPAIVAKHIENIRSYSGMISSNMFSLVQYINHMLRIISGGMPFPVTASLWSPVWRTGLSTINISSPVPVFVAVKPVANIGSIKIGTARSFEVWDATNGRCIVPGCHVIGDVLFMPVRYARIIAKQGTTLSYFMEAIM